MVDCWFGETTGSIKKELKGEILIWLIFGVPRLARLNNYIYGINGVWSMVDGIYGIWYMVVI